MRLHWRLISLLEIQFIASTLASIAGVTYMDDFDFEERYRNVYECDPFHWHPLHMPEYCAEMYEKLIRSGLARKTPHRVVRERESPFVESQVVYSFNPIGYPTFEISNVYQPASIEILAYERPPLSPYEKMLELIRKDVERHPSAPTIGHIPNLGPVAIYHQPVSTKSKNMIKKISGAYAKAGKRNHGGKYYGKIYIKEASDKEVKTSTVPPADEEQGKLDEIDILPGS